MSRFAVAAVLLAAVTATVADDKPVLPDEDQITSMRKRIQDLGGELIERPDAAPGLAKHIVRMPKAENDTLKQLPVIGFPVVLDLSGSNVDDFGMAALKRQPLVNGVTLNRTKITGAALKDLRDLPALRELHLGNVPLDRDDFDELKRFKDLTTLGVAGTGVTDDDVAKLTGLKKLKAITLMGNAVTDIGAEKLKSMRGLTYINIWGTGTSETLADELKAALPGCTVVKDRPRFGK